MNGEISSLEFHDSLGLFVDLELELDSLKAKYHLHSALLHQLTIKWGSKPTLTWEVTQTCPSSIEKALLSTYYWGGAIRYASYRMSLGHRSPQRLIFVLYSLILTPPSRAQLYERGCID